MKPGIHAHFPLLIFYFLHHIRANNQYLLDSCYVIYKILDQFL